MGPMACSALDMGPGLSIHPASNWSWKCEGIFVFVMEEASGAITNPLGLPEQACLSSPPLYSWQFHGPFYVCLRSLHLHRPTGDSHPNPKFSFPQLYSSFSGFCKELHLLLLYYWPNLLVLIPTFSSY